MKIVTKHIDNLKSSLIKTKVEIPQFLVYLMTDDNVSISCEIVNTDEMRTREINKIQENYGYNLPIHEVSYHEFINNMKKNQPTYGGDK